MCEATKQWEEVIENRVINMMGVRKNEEEKLDAKEAIERLERRSKQEGLTEGRIMESVASVRNIMNSLHITREKAMKLLCIADDLAIEVHAALDENHL